MPLPSWEDERRMKIRCVFGVKFLILLKIQAITLYPWILFSSASEETPERLFRHELEHFYQVQRLGWWHFYLNYLKSYFHFRRQGLGHQEAYWAIPYEVEARNSEGRPLSELEWAAVGRKKQAL